MTAQQSSEAGYKIIYASPFEVGLVYKGEGVRTWWCGDFGCKIPSLDHPAVQEAIEANERYLRNLARRR